MRGYACDFVSGGRGAGFLSDFARSGQVAHGMGVPRRCRLNTATATLSCELLGEVLGRCILHRKELSSDTSDTYTNTHKLLGCLGDIPSHLFPPPPPPGKRWERA